MMRHVLNSKVRLETVCDDIQKEELRQAANKPQKSKYEPTLHAACKVFVTSDGAKIKQALSAEAVCQRMKMCPSAGTADAAAVPAATQATAAAAAPATAAALPGAPNAMDATMPQTPESQAPQNVFDQDDAAEGAPIAK